MVERIKIVKEEDKPTEEDKLYLDKYKRLKEY